MSKQCELCAQPARMYCESDHASLCWGCDAKVHGANFLVARHTRCLLCSTCQAPTPWRASGARLGPSFSTCQRCRGAGAEGDSWSAEKGEGMGDRAWVEADNAGSGDLGWDDDKDDEEDGEEEEEEEEDEEEEGDNQVVPWTIEEVPAAATPPPVASCTSSEESSSGRLGIDQGFLKRRRGNTALSTFYAANPMHVPVAGQPWAADLIDPRRSGQPRRSQPPRKSSKGVTSSSDGRPRLWRRQPCTSWPGPLAQCSSARSPAAGNIFGRGNFPSDLLESSNLGSLMCGQRVL